MSTQARKNDFVSRPRAVFSYSEKWFRALIENSSDAVALLDADGTLLYASSSVLRVIGYSPEELLGHNGLENVPEADHTIVAEQLAEVALTAGKTKTIEHRFVHKNGTLIWVESTVTNLLHDPDVMAVVSNFRNITERKEAEERQRVLNEVSNLLTSSFDHQVTLQEIAQLIVPSLADYCRIAILDDNQQIKEITANHFDPDKIALVQELYEQYKDHESTTHGLQKILQMSQPELISVVSPTILENVSDNQELVLIVEKLALKSYMGVPLIARGKTVGAITFSSTRPHRYYSQVDIVFVQELARRIALMLDNARLYQEAQEEIAERKQVETQLRQSEERKDMFISMASHELKTPVTSLKGFTSILQRRSQKQGDEQALLYLEKIDRQVNKLTKLINDLLDVSKIQTGKLVYQEESVNLVDLVREIIENVQGTTQTHTLSLEGASEVQVLCDKDRIGQVFINLLTNAIKYSPHAKQVVVRVSEDAGNAIASVQDFGIGIASVHQEKIFEQFYQVTDPEEKTYPGLGIGLYISTEIVRRHGGRLWVESHKGEGSTFYVALPLLEKGVTHKPQY